MALSTRKQSSLGGDSTQQNQYQTQSQLNAQRGTKAAVQNGVQPKLRNGDTTIAVSGETLIIKQGAAKGTTFDFAISSAATGLQPYQTGTVAPSVATNFPNDGDFGWYENTTGPTYYWVINHGGTLRNISLSTLAGSLATGQHGDLSADSGAIHAFTQITGTLSDTQHGDRSTTTTTMHKFAQISGTISAAQHGDISGTSVSGDRHAPASATVYGFLSPTHYSLLNGATSSATSDTLVLRGASYTSFNSVNVSTSYRLGTNVIIDTTYNITASAVTGTAGGAYGSTEQTMITDLKTLANDLRAGLLAIGGLFT